MIVRLTVYFLVLITLLSTKTEFLIEAQSLVPSYRVTAIAVSGDGTLIAVAGRSEQINENEYQYYIDLLDTKTLQIVGSVEIDYLSDDIDLSHDGGYVASNGYSDLTIIDTSTGEIISRFGAGPAEIGSFDLNPIDERLVFSVASVSRVTSINNNFPTPIFVDPESGMVSDVIWSNSGIHLASITYDSENIDTLQIWRDAIMVTDEDTSPSFRLSGGGYNILWSPSDEFIATIDTDDKVRIIDIVTGIQTNLPTPTSESPGTIAWSPDNTQIAASGFGEIWIWDVASGVIIESIETVGYVDEMIWIPSLGLVHNDREAGLYINGELVVEPVSICSNIISASDTTALINAITNAHSAGLAQTICLLAQEGHQSH